MICRFTTIASIVLLLIIVSLLPLSSQTSPEKVFILGGEQEPPLKWIDENGKIRGIEIEILDEIYKRMSDLVPKYEFKIFDSSVRVKFEGEKGWIDQYITLSIKPERLEFYLYPKESYLKQNYYFFVTKDFLAKAKKKKKPVKFDKFEDLRGYCVGMTKEYAYTPEFLEAVQDSILTVDIVVVNNLNPKKLLAGRIDLFPSNDISFWWDAAENNYTDKVTYLPKPLKSTDYYNPFCKNSSYPGVGNGIIAERYDKILNDLKKEGFVRKVFHKYGIKDYGIR